MKKLLVNSLIVTIFCSYIVPVDAMFIRSKEQQQQMRLEKLRERPQRLIEKREQQRIAREAEQASQQGWLSRGWQAAQQKVSQFATGVRERAMVTHQKASNVISEVRNWSWSRTLVVLSAIALTFGVVIGVYNSNGNLVETFGDKSFFAAVVPSLMGVAFKYFEQDFNQTTALLIQRSNAITKDPQVAIDGLRREYERDIVGTTKNKILMKACYDAAIKYFEEIIMLQKNLLLAAAEKKSSGDPKEQEKLLFSEEFKSDVLSQTFLGSKEAVDQSKKTIVEKKITEEKVDEIIAWVSNRFPKNVARQIEFLESLIGSKSQPVDFPVDIQTAGEAIERVVSMLYLM